jgi:hypothetical protein
MTTVEMARLRAAAQRLTRPRRGSVQSIVAWLGAVQAQDYGLARWSVAERLAGGTTAAVERAVAAGTILRTHVMRPTWHFVPRDDLRWMQQLTAPRVRLLMAYNDRRNGVDADLTARSSKAIAKAIEKDGHLTRAEISAVLARAGVAVNAWLVSQLLIHAELRAIVCSGVPRGGHQTYALVEERAPRSRKMTGDEALAELALRFFRSHAPATVKDFRWWSGLDTASAARGAAALGGRFERVAVEGRHYVIDGGARAPRADRPHAIVIQPFDEIAVAYSESRDLLDGGGAAASRGWSLLARGVLIDGQLAGRWTVSPGGTKRVAWEPLRRLTAAERAAADRAIERFRAAIWPGADRTDSGRSPSRSTRTRSRPS